MSNKIDTKLDSKLKNNSKNIKDTNKQSVLNNNQSNAKVKQRNLNFKPKTPIKDEKSKNNNKQNLNNNTIAQSNNNNNNNIINNLSINININITNNEINKSKTIVGGTKNRSANKKKPIGLKKDELKKNENSIIKKNSINNKKNNSKEQRKNNSFHQRINSGGFKNMKSHNIKNNNKINNNNKKNFNLTTTGFHPKKMENTKGENNHKNASVDEIKMPIKNNKEVDKNSITINVGKINIKDEKKQEKNVKFHKKGKNKRNTVSPGIDRGLLNQKQIELLNHSVETRKVKNDNNIETNKTISTNNFHDINSSPLVKKKKIIKNRAKSISNNANNINLNANNNNNNNNINNNKTSNVNNKNNSNENSNKKEIVNYKAKPVGKTHNNQINPHNVDVKIKKSYNNEIDKHDIYRFGFKSPNARNKKEGIFKKDKNIKDDLNEKDDERRNSHGIKLFSLVKVDENKKKKPKDDEKKKEEEQKQKEEEKRKKEEEEKRKKEEEEKRKKEEEEKRKKEEEEKKKKEEEERIKEEERKREEEQKRKEEEEQKRKEEEEKRKKLEEQKRKEEEELKRKEEEERKKKEEEELKRKEEEEQKRKEEEMENETKQQIKMNPSKSQLDISPDFIKNELDFLFGEAKEKPQLKSSDKESKKILRIESICKKGFAGPGVKKTNQDNFFIYKNFVNNPSSIFIGVCDGHGSVGQDVSGYLVNNLPQNLHTALLSKEINNIESANFKEITKIISSTFIQTNTNLVNDDRVDSTFSGSTCTTLIYTPERIISANVGDSRCVVGKFDGKNWSAKNLTRDHKPNEPDEMKRILDNGGRVESYKDEDGEFVGPERVWLKEDDIPGLAMSRSFGDEIAHTVGVIAEPESFDYYLVHEDKFLLLGSDGIWEFISSEECVNIVKDYYLKDDIDGALNYLYKESSKRWIMEEEVIDDITLIIVFLG